MQKQGFTKTSQTNKIKKNADQRKDCDDSYIQPGPATNSPELYDHPAGRRRTMSQDSAAAAEAFVPVLWLEAGQHPLETVTAALEMLRQQGQPVHTLHWVSHGRPGALWLSAYNIDRDALLAHQKLIAQWGIRELALWSCKAGAKKNFISLWQELTGARVWSSEGPLGRNREEVAQWKLDSGAAGEQAPALPVVQQTLRSWPHQLAAPVASGTPTLTAITEDNTTPAGDTIANLFSSSFSDADSDTLLGVAITANTANSSTEGIWQYSTDDGSNWTAVPTTGLADTTAFYLEANSKLRFLPNADFNGTPGALTAHLIDSTYNGASESNSDYFLQFIETSAEVKATLTLDPTAFSASSAWSKAGSFATIVGPADAAIGGTVGTVGSPFSNPNDQSDVTLSTNIPLTGAQSTAPNLVFGQYSIPDSATGDLFALYSANNDLNAIIAYDQDMYDSLVNETNPVVSTATWNNTTLVELGIGEGTGTFSTTSGSLSFSGAYSVDIFEAGDSIDISTNGGTTAISANTLSLGTSVAAINDAPEVANAGGTLAFTEGDGATVIDSSLSISDADDTNIESATVTISSGFQSAEDVLAFSDTSAIEGAWNSSTGVLTLTGSDTLANYKAALESVTYNNTSENPNTANRTISWVVNDGTDSSSTVTSTVTITGGDDSAIVSSGSSGSGAEDSTITGTLSASDVEGLTDGSVFTVSSEPTNGSASIDPASGEWSYTPTANFYGTDSFTVTITDDAGGTTTQAIALTITAVDDSIPAPEPTDETNIGFIIVTPTPSATGDQTSDSEDDLGDASQTITNTSSTQTGSAALVENSGNNGNLVTATLPPEVSIASTFSLCPIHEPSEKLPCSIHPRARNLL